MLLLNDIRIWGSIDVNTFSLSDLQGQCQGHSDFESLYVIKEQH